VVVITQSVIGVVSLISVGSGGVFDFFEIPALMEKQETLYALSKTGTAYYLYSSILFLPSIAALRFIARYSVSWTIDLCS